VQFGDEAGLRHNAPERLHEGHIVHIKRRPRLFAGEGAIPQSHGQQSRLRVDRRL